MGDAPNDDLDIDKFFDGNTPMTGMALAHHEMVGEFEKAGFSRREALYLTACTMNGNPGMAPEG